MSISNGWNRVRGSNYDLQLIKRGLLRLPAVQRLRWTARLALESLRTTNAVTLRETNISRNIIFRNLFLYVGTIHYGLCKEIL